MTRHRKAPRSRRNLMVFDLLTTPQGHQFDTRLSFSVYPGFLIILFNLVCRMAMFRNFNFCPQAPTSPTPWA